MYASSIKDHVKKWPAISRLFEGVFSADTVPNSLDIDHFAIVNTDTSDKKGTHWWIFLRRDVDFIEQFDSLGVKEKETNLLKDFDCYVEKNTNKLQPVNSRNCGLFCLYFIIHRFLNYEDSFVDILNQFFTKNADKNEELVLNFFKPNKD